MQQLNFGALLCINIAIWPCLSGVTTFKMMSLKITSLTYLHLKIRIQSHGPYAKPWNVKKISRIFCGIQMDFFNFCFWKCWYVPRYLYLGMSQLLKCWDFWNEMWLLDIQENIGNPNPKNETAWLIGWKLELLRQLYYKTFYTYMTMMIWINYLKVRAILLIQKEDCSNICYYVGSSFHNVASLYGRH